MPRLSALLWDWELDTCLRCHLSKQLPSTPSRLAVSKQRSSNRSFSRSTVPRPTVKPPTPHSAYKRLQSSSTRLFYPEPSKEEVDQARNAGASAPAPNVRAKLRRWLAEQKEMEHPTTTILPIEPRDTTADVNNALTRPEDVAEIDLEAAEETSEEVGDALAQFDHMVDQSDQAPVTDQIRKGDLLELDFNFGVPVFAIYLGHSSAGCYQYFANTGKFFFSTNNRFTFKIDNFLPAAEVDALLPYLPENPRPGVIPHKKASKELPETLALSLLNKLNQFQNRVERIYRRYYSRIESIHSKLAHPTDLKFMKIQDITKEILGPDEQVDGSYPPHVLFAVTNALVKQTFGFVYTNARSVGSDHLLTVYSKEDVAALTRMQECIRAFQESAALEAGGFAVPRVVTTKAQPLKDFAQKSRKILSYSRQTQRSTPDGTIVSYDDQKAEGGSAKLQDGQLPSFSASDMDIIRVLKLHGLANALVRHPTLRTIPNIIMRVLGDYTGPRLAETSAKKFLVELGVLNPFYNNFAFDHYVWGPSRDLDKSLAQADESVRAGASVADVVEVQDSMAHLRKDWQDLPVFCIDSESTGDLDDGISIEPASGEDGQTWLHVHIAHLSSMIKPKSLLGQVAQHRLSSQYFAGGRLPMLPKWIVAESSLRSGRPVMTFSARLDSGGNVLETTIQPGYIRNVVQLSPERIDAEVFGVRRQPMDSRMYTIGGVNEGPTTNKVTSKPIDESYADRLRQLRTMCEILYKRRPMASLDNLGVPKRQSSKFGSLFVRAKEGTAYTSVSATPSRPHFSRQDPLISLTSHSMQSSSARDMSTEHSDIASIIVEEAMLLSGEIAGGWAAKRGVPLIYTGTRLAAQGLEKVAAGIRQDYLRDDARQSAINSTYRFFGGNTQSSVPIEHKLVGSKHWTKVSSPLRKFQDLANLWQIDAALRQERLWGDSLLGNTDTSFLPFGISEIDDIINLSSARSASQKAYSSNEKDHWRFQFFLRAYVMKELDDITNGRLLCRVGNRDFKDRKLGMLAAYDIECSIMTDTPIADSEEMENNSLWEVELKSVNCDNHRIAVTPVRRLFAGRGR